MKVSNIYISAITSLFLLSACGDKSQDAKGPSVPSAVIAQKYEGKIVRQPAANRGKDDGWYFVKNGQRKWISDGAWLAKNGFKPESVIEISSTDFNAIPEDPIPAN